ncbi:MAG: MFS transporter [Firmicutes bacterium]|nr:MFS transporter [Bacillota bacterium]
MPSSQPKVVTSHERRLLSLGYAMTYMAVGTMFPFFNLYLAKNLGWSGTRIGSVMAMGSLLVLLTQPMWGRISDLSDKNKILAGALGINAVLALVQPLAAGSFLIFTILRLSHAVFSCSTGSMLDGIVLDVLGDDKDTYGQYRLWGSFGFALASLAFGRIYEVVGFSSMFIAYFAITAVAAGVVLRIDTSAHQGEAAKAPIQLGPVLANPVLVMLLIGLFLVMTPTAASDNFLTLYFDAMGAPPSLTGYAFGLTALVEVPMFLLAPGMIRRFGHKPVLVASTGLFGLKLLLNAMCPVPWIAVTLQTLVGVGFAFYQVSAVLMIDALVPQQFRSTGQAVLATVSWSLSGILGNLIFGRLLDTADVFTAFRLGGYVALVGTLFIYLLVPSEAKQGTYTHTDV